MPFYRFVIRGSGRPCSAQKVVLLPASLFSNYFSGSTKSVVHCQFALAAWGGARSAGGWGAVWDGVVFFETKAKAKSSRRAPPSVAIQHAMIIRSFPFEKVAT